MNEEVLRLDHRLLEVRSEVEYLRSAMHQWGGPNCSDMVKARSELRDAMASFSGMEAKINELSKLSCSSRTYVGDLSKQSEAFRATLERNTTQLQEHVSRAQHQVSSLQDNVERDLEGHKVFVHDKADQVQAMVRMADAEKSKVLSELQQWRLRIDERLETLGVSVREGEAAREWTRRVQTELDHHKTERADAHRALQEEVQQETRNTSQKHSLCVSELHRIIHMHGEQLKVDQATIGKLNVDLGKLREEVRDGEQRSRLVAAERTSAQRAEMAEGHQKLEQRLTAEVSRLDEQLDAARTHSSELQGALGQAESRLRGDREAACVELQKEISSVRTWAAEQVKTEVGRAQSAMRSEATTLRSNIERLERRVAELSQTLSSVEVRLETQNQATGERLGKVSEQASATDTRLTSVDTAWRKRVEENAFTLAQLESRIGAEAGVVQDRLEEAGRMVSAAEDRLNARAQTMTDSLAVAENRLSNEDALIRERLRSLVAEQSEVDKNLNHKIFAVSNKQEALTKDIASAEQRLQAEDAATRSQTKAVSDNILAVESRLCEQDKGLAKRCDGLVESIAATERRLSTESSAASDRLKALRETLRITDSRLAAQDACAEERLVALAADLTGAEKRLVAEDGMAQKRLEALVAKLAESEKLQSAENLKIHKRINSATENITVSEERVVTETRCVQDRIEKFREAIFASRQEHSEGCAALQEKLEGHASKLDDTEKRLLSSGEKMKASIEQRSKEETVRLLSVIEQSHGSIDKLAHDLRDLGDEQERTKRDFDCLGNVVRDVEIRTMPYRAGLCHSDLERLRSAAPASERRRSASKSPQPYTASFAASSPACEQNSLVPLKPKSPRPFSARNTWAARGRG